MAHRHEDMVNFIWSIASDELRFLYGESEYGKVILPFLVLRRFDCVLADTRDSVKKALAELPSRLENKEPALLAATKVGFFNTSPLSFSDLLNDKEHVLENLDAYIQGFSTTAREVLEDFKLFEYAAGLADNGLLYQVVSRFAALDLHPITVSNIDMGLIFEELIRVSSEARNESAGEHFTPREVIRLLVKLLFLEDEVTLSTPGKIVTILDPAAGTGGMLSVADETLRSMNAQARIEPFGQEISRESYAICRSDLMIKGQNPANVRRGDTLAADAFAGQRFDYVIANPPFGDHWKKSERIVREEHFSEGLQGRFGAGLPSIKDSSLLFLQHMIAKMKTAGDGGARLAVILSGSPLFVDGPPSGRTANRLGNANSIRKWILENDLLEAVIALPDELFYNTDIATCIWILSTHKRAGRRGKVHLLDARNRFTDIAVPIGNKRKLLAETQIDEIVREYGAFESTGSSRIVSIRDLGYRQVTVCRPLRQVWQGGEGAQERLAAHRAFKKLVVEEVESGEPQYSRALLDKVRWVLPKPTAQRKHAETAVAQIFEAVSGTAPPRKLKDAVLESLAKQCATAPPVLDADGQPIPDPDLEMTERIPLGESVAEYLDREISPGFPDAWVSDSEGLVGYEIPVTRHFIPRLSLRSLDEIERDLSDVQTDVAEILSELRS